MRAGRSSVACAAALLIFAIGGCGRGPYLEAREDIRLYETPDAAMASDDPVGILPNGTRTEIVDCLYMKSDRALGVRSEDGEVLYFVHGDFDQERNPNCRG